MGAHFRTLLAVALTALGLPAQTHEPSRGVDTAEALRLLTLGNERFVRGELLQHSVDEGTRRSLLRQQRPYAIVVTTSDSRVAPELVFNAGLGEIYTIRVAGNVCDPATLASIEFAAWQLGIELCIVLGHDRDASLKLADSALPASPAGERLHAHLESSLRWAARQGLTGEERLLKAAEENVYMTIQDALHRSSTLRLLTSSDRFEFVPARYESETGRVEWLPKRRMTTYAAAHREATEHRPARVRGFPPHVAMRMLQAGHRRFLSQAATDADVSPERRRALLEGQRPHTVVVADADSRVSPEILFDAGLGDLYVIRVAGTFLDDEVLASVEHAVENTGASLIVVLGHDRNDVVELAARHGHVGGKVEVPASMRQLFTWLEPSIVAARGEGLEHDALTTRAVELNCHRFVEALRARSELLRDAEREGFVAMFGAMYEIGSGDLSWLDVEHGRRIPDGGHAAPAGESTHSPGFDDHRADDRFAHGLDAHAPASVEHGYSEHGHLEHGHPEPDAPDDGFFELGTGVHGDGSIEADGYVVPDPEHARNGPDDSLLTTLLGAFAVASFGVAVILMSSNSQLRKRVGVLAAAVGAQSERAD